MSLPHPWLRVLLPVSFCALFALGCVVPRSDGGWYEEEIPGGSYRATCEGIRMDGYRLKASCGTELGKWRRTSLDIRACDGDIANRDGYLVCSQEDQYYGGLPPGTYLRSCTNVRVRRGELQADCRRDDHGWRETAIPVDACRRFKNRDGRLVCE